MKLTLIDLTSLNLTFTFYFFQVHDRIVVSDAMSDRQKSFVCEKLAANESRLLDGANEYLQVLDLCSLMMTQIAKGA
jgi:replication factor C subunit 2/4